MACKACPEEAEPTLYSLPPRRLALELICQQLAELILRDEELVEQAIEACRKHLERLTQPDPREAAAVRREIERLTTQINFILDAPGETKQDRTENRERLGKLRSDRAKAQKRLAEIEEAARNPATLPDTDVIRALTHELATSLREAADSESPEEQAALHDIIAELTGGRIVVTQQGERKPHEGWLRASFRVRLLQVVAGRLGFPAVNDEGVEVNIDFKRPSRKDEQAEEAKRLYDQDLMHMEIARRMGVHRNRVTQLLQHWCKMHGEELPDGRSRRSKLQKKQSVVPTYQAVSEPVKQMWDEGLSVLEIGRRLDCSDTTAWRAIAHWHRVHDLPVPTAKDRRERLAKRARQFYDEGWEIKAIAARLGYTTRGMKYLLERSFEAEGQKMPDGRSRRFRNAS